MKKVLGVFIISFFFLCITSCGSNSFNISQSKSEIELGDKVDVIQFFDYDSKDIAEIRALNEDDLNTNKIGNYDIRFQIRNTRGKTQEMTFKFSVIDTQPPTLTVIENDIYIASGTDFDINNYATSSDKSNNCQIKYDGEIDVSKEGIYNIDVYAVDDSGNASEKENIKITVEDRSDCDIRNAKFGDNKETVKRYETLECTDDSYNSLTYLTDLSGEDACLVYCFNNSDELYIVGYSIYESHTDYSQYISAYNNIKENVTKKYGSPNNEWIKKGSLYSYCNSEAEALQLGEIAYYSVWELERYKIEMGLSTDNYEVTFILKYTSNEFGEDEDLSNY